MTQIPAESLLWSRVDREASRYMEKHHQTIGFISLSPDLYALVADTAENGLDPFGIGAKVRALPKGTKDTVLIEKEIDLNDFNDPDEKPRRRVKRHLG